MDYKEYECEVCGDKWLALTDTADDCTACTLEADRPRKAAKVRRLFEQLKATAPLSYESSYEACRPYGRLCMRIVEDVALAQCDKYGMWPYKRYLRRDGSSGYILVYFEPG